MSTSRSDVNGPPPPESNRTPGLRADTPALWDGIFGIRLTALLKRFGSLLASNSIRNWILGLFFVYLARKDAAFFGHFMLAVSAGTIVKKIVEFGYDQYLIKKLGAAAVPPLDEITSVNLVKLTLLLVSVAGLLIFCLLMGYPTRLVLVVVLIGLGMGLSSIGDSLYMMFRIQGRQLNESAMRLFSIVVALFCVVALLAVGLEPEWASVLLILEAVINIAVAAVVLRNDFQRVLRASLKEVAAVVKGGLPFTLIASFAIFANKTNIFFLQNFGGAESVAEYMATWLVVDTVSCAVSAHLLSGVVYPLMSKNQTHTPAPTIASTRDLLCWLLLLAWPICLILHQESGLLIHLIYGDGYTRAPQLQQILVWTIPLAFCQNLCLCLLMARANVWRLAVIFGIGLFANLVLNAILIPPAGADGAAWVILLTKLCLCSLVFAECQRTFALTRPRDWMVIFGFGLFLTVLYLLLSLTLPPLAALTCTLALYFLSLRAGIERFITNPSFGL